MCTQTMNPFHFDLALKLKNNISSFVSFKMQLRIKKVLNGNGKTKLNVEMNIIAENF